MSLVAKVEILGEFKSLTKATKGAKNELKDLNAKVGRFSKSMKAGLAGIGIGLSFGFIKDALTEATKAALDDAKSQAILKNALVNTTGANDAQVKAVEESIAGWQRQFAILDDDLRPAYQKLVTSTKDTAKANDLMQIAMDVSAGTGKDLTSVATALAKAHDGNFTSLEKLVPGIKNAKDPMNELAASFENAAQTAADNDPLKNIEVIFADIQETVGAELLPDLKEFAEWLKSDQGTKFIDDVVTVLKEAIGFAKDLFGWLKDINSIGNVNKDTGTGEALRITRVAGDTRGVAGNIARGGNMSTITNNNYNVTTNTNATGKQIVSALRTYEKRTGVKYIGGR